MPADQTDLMTALGLPAAAPELVDQVPEHGPAVPLFAAPATTRGQLCLSTDDDDQGATRNV